MSTLEYQEKRRLEQLFNMSSGYVLGYSDRTFGNLIGDVAGIDIHADEYLSNGTSKANKFRTFWEKESDTSVGKVILELVRECRERSQLEDLPLVEECEATASRLLAGEPNLSGLAEIAARFDADYLRQQISRMEEAVESDPALAIGTAKELIETCCKTMLEERGESFAKDPDMPELTKAVFRQLKMTRDDVPDAIEGSEAIKRVLSNLGSISNELARLRNLYGTGHGKLADAPGLSPRHAKLAVGSAATLVRFLFESHTEQQSSEISQVPSRPFRF